MLVLQNISPQQGQHYYHDDISLANLNQNQSSWYGQGANFLALANSVDPETFQSLLSGKFSNGSRFRRLPSKKEYKQRGAIDCIFAAPKSVSLLALVKQNTEIFQAHDLAVNHVLDLIEERYSATRIRTDNQRITVNTKNLVIAKFPHSTSRELDPHLHTHCLILNMTRTPDNRWLSLKNDELFLHQKFLGRIYQNELAQNIKQLGYEVCFQKYGQMEIKNSDRSIIEVASKRHWQIKAKLNQNSTWKQEKLAWATTRKAKQHLSSTELKQKWDQDLVFNSPEKTSKAPTTEVISAAILEQSLQQAKKWHPTAFRRESIEEEILSKYPGRFSWSDINKVVPNNHFSNISASLKVKSFSNWQDFQRNFEKLSPQEQQQTLILVADLKQPLAEHLPIQVNSPEIADPISLKKHPIVPFQSIFVLNQASSPQINQYLKESLRRLKRTFKSRVRGTCDFSSYIPPQKKQLFQESPEYYQAWYSQLKEQLSSQSSTIKELDIKICRKLASANVPISQIRKVLARSDYIHQLKNSVHEDPYRQKAVDYVHSVESRLSTKFLAKKRRIQPPQRDIER